LRFALFSMKLTQKYK